MKKSILKNAIWIFILVISNVTIYAQVLWYGDPNLSVNDNFRRLDPNGNSNPTGNDCVDDPNNPPFVTTPIDAEFGKFWRITKPTSRKRAEFARTTGDVNSFVPQKGGTYYYGWRWRINATPNLINGIAVFQWKTDDGGDVNMNKQNYPFNMEYDGNVLNFNAFGPAEPNWNRPGSITQRRTTLWRQAIQEDTWVSFVIKVKVDDTFDATNNRYEGYVEFWFNGIQQTLSNIDSNEYQIALANSNTRAYHKTFDGIEVYPKWGAYNQNACDFEVVTDYDEMRVTTTFESALPDGTLSKKKIDAGYVYISNPVNNELSIKGMTNDVVEVSIYSLLGTQILTKKVGSQTSLKFDIAALTSGMYIVEMKGETGNFIKKIIKL